MESGATQLESSGAPGRRGRAALVLLVIAALFFAAIAPTLRWLEFSGGSENLVVATALEIRRDGTWQRWIEPTLQGEPRIAKPPLAAWVAAASIRADTLRALDSPDESARADAYRDLAWQVRWPALLCACLGLLAVCGLGRVVAGGDAGVLAALICGSTIFFLRYGRGATVDVHLFLWVAVANYCLARALLEGRWWGGCIGAGAALGLALMSKGPVALLQTVVPVALWAVWHRRPRRIREEWPVPGRASLAWPIVTGVVVMLAVAVPWYALVAVRSGGNVFARWKVEVLRAGATDMPAGSVLNYLLFLPEFLPWAFFAAAGAIAAVRYARKQKSDHLMLALLLVAVPIVVMTFFRDRKDRYLLPMVGPASVLAAHAVRESLLRGEMRTILAHRVLVAILGIAGPVAALLLTRRGGLAWPGDIPIVIGAAALSAGLLVALRRPGRLVWAGALVMLIVQAVGMHFYQRTDDGGRSGMKPFADAIRQSTRDADIYYYRPDGKLKLAPNDLAIYLNRPVVRTTTLPAPIPARRVVVVTVQQKGEPPPPFPPGWVEVADVQRDAARMIAVLWVGQ